MSPHSKRLRRMVNRLNKLVTLLQKRGVVFSDMHILTVVGRRTGELRDVPVSVLEVAGARYVFQAYPKSAWVANVRASPTVTLTRGRRSSEVRMTELAVPERRSLLRDHVAGNPTKLGEWFVKTGLIEEGTPDGLAAAAERIAIFRVDPA
ncbi:nitroreductase/quinone reductase family protein [Nocardia goodfellowii]|uniref:Deazaflavin-dependent oxidoreductase (Nitroreductase family) n=1 Tax=Nocardia goodfellowii TaxID=882446 RepID=A0ABS4QIS9_9NOCA|nr:nitroreductase/quinone reductase family protein [Nocardia goodfellowii]MBP2191488.1 deazaflavin-dependent oxidoreductase (nitroreductase family) [Nocardia goodfellowii]